MKIETDQIIMQEDPRLLGQLSPEEMCDLMCGKPEDDLKMETVEDTDDIICEVVGNE